MNNISVTINDFSWPRLDIVVQRGAYIKHLTLHHDQDQKIQEEVAQSLKLALEEILRRHHPAALPRN